ncbi:MAG: hypothetical protein GWN18_08105 [Thermoplasmata archaeon]|nr:hypothetical protein [Thermoplasmata archaeon]NIS12005.1 hypothetical protein [Thermoplasmata archaeon]NIS19929.1 hypothetical protein [Thermoplasmata archaeon]NIT77119.1 hypothetical protein [Thermoplasmata archaeon]NIU49039.1 hypothetical protein [Thermoplasmata archaeon]
MAKGSGKDKKKDEKSKKDKKSKGKREDKPKKEAQKRSRYVPIKTAVHEPGMKEVSALRAFLTSLIFFTLILAPVLGLGLYFMWDAVVDLFPTQEDAFMAGMAAGVVLAFVISLVFTRRAVASS